MNFSYSAIAFRFRLQMDLRTLTDPVVRSDRRMPIRIVPRPFQNAVKNNLCRSGPTTTLQQDDFVA
jgi:hypothetical protein